MERNNLFITAAAAALQGKKGLVSAEDPDPMQRCGQFFARELARYCVGHSESNKATLESPDQLISSFREAMVRHRDLPCG